MAITVDTANIVKRSRTKTSNKIVVVADIPFSGTYNDGGDVAGFLLGTSLAVAAQNFDLNRIEAAWLLDPNVGGMLAGFEPATQKVRLYNPVTAHTHAAGAIGGATANDAAPQTPAGTMIPKYTIFDPQGITGPAMTLTHNADPVGGLAASPLYGVSAGLTQLTNLMLSLESTLNGGVDVAGSLADATIYATGVTPRFFVKHEAAPGGVPILVNEGAADRLEWDNASSAYIAMPLEAVAGAPQGLAILVRVNGVPGVVADATHKQLYMDDNGAAGAQLVFVDTGGVGGVIPAGDHFVVYPVGCQPTVAGNLGSFTGAAFAAHNHAVGTLASAATAAAAAGVGTEVVAGTNLGAQTMSMVLVGV